jgi:hypothetical protein
MRVPRWLSRCIAALALLAVVMPAFGLVLVCAEDCREEEAGECPPVCTLCATCALPALPTLSPAVILALEPRAPDSSAAAPSTLLGVRSDILHVPRQATS